MSSPMMMASQAPAPVQGAVVAKAQLHEDDRNYEIKRSDTATTGTTASGSPSPSHNHHKNKSNLSIDETLSTANCDDSETASANMTGTRLYAPPVSSVDVDKRSIRQRLRDQEAKITALLHKPATTSFSSSEPPSSPASEGVLLKLVQTLEQDLKKTEAEKTKLQEELEQLQKKVQDKEETATGTNDHDNQIDAAELATVKVDNTAAADLSEQVETLQLELRRKTHETLLLQDRWETTLQRMVQYQTDLETHNLHYTDYAAQQFQAGDEALQEIRELTAKDQPDAHRQLGKRAKHMMSTLLKDLEVLGERYQESRVNQEQQLAHWKQKHLESQHKAHVLEKTLKEHEIAVPEEEATFTELSTPLMSVPKSAQTQTSLDDLSAQAQAAELKTQHIQVERDALQEEVERLQRTMTQLQSVTQQQQDALQAAAFAAAEKEAAEKNKKKKKKWFSFGKKKKNKDEEAKSARLITVPTVDVAAALAPMQSESQRFDRFQEELQSQSQAFQELRQVCQKQATQKAQLQQTVTELRVQQQKAIAENDNRALRDLQALFDELQVQQGNEQAAAQAELKHLRAQLEANSSTVEPSSGDYLHFS